MCWHTTLQLEFYLCCSKHVLQQCSMTILWSGGPEQAFSQLQVSLDTQVSHEM